MPALKMKAKASTACTKELSVTQLSRKISKESRSLVRLCCETADLDTSLQNCYNDSDKVELSATKSKSNEANEASECNIWHDGEFPAFQIWFPSDEDNISVNNMDSPPPSCPANFEARSSPVSDDNAIHFKSMARNDTGYEDGAAVPDIDADYFGNWISESFGCQASDVLDYYTSDMNVLLDGINGFDDSLSNDLFLKLGYVGQNLMLDMTKECMKLPALEEKVEMVGMHLAASCEELANNSDYSQSYFMSQTFDREVDVNSTNVDLDDEDFDPQLFIRNFLDLSDMEPNLLPSLVLNETARKRVTLVLDLDETLVHSSMEPSDDADFTFQVLFNRKEHMVYVRQRPFLRSFLERVAEMFEIIVFTASESIYAEKLLDILDPDGKLIARRAYRESCIFSDGNYAKDLTVLGVDLAKVAIIDNSPQVFRLQVENGIPIESWFDDPSDRALISLIPFLETLAAADDVRPIIAEKFNVSRYNFSHPVPH